jgi:hypothetical protein
MKKFFLLLFFIFGSKGFSQVQKRILVEYKPQSNFIQYVSNIAIYNKDNKQLFEDRYSHLDIGVTGGKNAINLVNVSDFDFPLKFTLVGNTLYTDNCNEKKIINYSLNNYSYDVSDFLNACGTTAELSTFSLANPTNNVGYCDNILISKQKLSSFYYRKPLTTEWIDISTVVPSALTTNGTGFDLNINLSDIPDLVDYNGPLNIKGAYTVEGLYDSEVSTTEGEIGYINLHSETLETNIITYNIIPCSPKLVGIPATEQTSCVYYNDGKLFCSFERPLDVHKNEYFLLTLIDPNDSTKLYGSKYVYPKDMGGSKTYVWTGLSAGTYKLRYQTYQNNGTKPASDETSLLPFTVTTPKKLMFSIALTAPKCYTDKGEMTITATGGTPPYFYFLNDETKTQFENFHTEATGLHKGSQTITKPDGIYKIKVTDTNGCIEKPIP